MIECINIGAKDTGQAGDVSETTDAQNSLPLVSAYTPVMSEVKLDVFCILCAVRFLRYVCQWGFYFREVCVFGLVCM